MTLTAFPYYGGKNNPKTLNWLLARLPMQNAYLEPFGGSAAILLNRPRAVIETFNDINQDVINFFRQLRDNGPELIRRLQLTPYSREEYEKAQKVLYGPIEGRVSDLVEWARLYYVEARQSFTAKTKSGWSYCRSIESRAAKSYSWAAGIEQLPDILERFRGVQIENDNALKIIRRYDTEDCIIYEDPPYLISTRTQPEGYNYEVNTLFHRTLAKLNRELKAKVAVSGYESDLYRELYEEKGWWRFDAADTSLSSSNREGGATRSMHESLWCNYDAESIAVERPESEQELLEDMID